MGLDVALGVIILIAAFRGWFQGFMPQIVRLGGLIASRVSGRPVRDYAKPYVASLSHRRSSRTWSTVCSGGSRPS